MIPEASELEALAPFLAPNARAIVELACLGQAVDAAVAREALGSSAYEALGAAEVLVESEGRARWPEHALFASPFGWLVGDRPLGYPGVTPRPARAFVDDESLLLAECVARAAPVGAALDLGCGAGLTVLAAAASAARVVGVDLQGGAVRAARIGVWASGIGDRVDLREGDLFGAIGPGERFDRIVAFLPALPLPVEARAPSHAGGGDGSALSARVVREAGAFLRDRGEVWLGAALLFAGERIATTELVEALDECGAEIAWSRGAAVPVDTVAEAAGVMLAAEGAWAEGWWAGAIRESFRAAGATALCPAVFRLAYRGLAETVAVRTDLVQWRR